MAFWESGWACLERALNSLTEADLVQVVYIRNEGHSVQEAILRQLAHLPYHVGQLVYLSKWLQADNWQSLSIPKGASATYNQAHFAKAKSRQFFSTIKKTEINKKPPEGGSQKLADFISLKRRPWFCQFLLARPPRGCHMMP